MIASSIKSEPIANVESEYLLIAALLFDARRVDAVADKLRQEDFAEPFFGRIFGLIVREHGKGKAINGLTIRPYLEGDAGYIAMGEGRFLAEITTSAALITDTALAAEQISDLAKRRRFMDAMRDALTMGADLNERLELVVDAADAALLEATGKQDGISEPTGAQAMMQLLRSTEEPKRSVLSKIIPSMDELLGGMRPKQLVIGAGRPGMGKTAAALSYALGAAQNGHGVLFVSLEMSAKELAARMAADLSFDGRGGVPFSDINSDEPSPRAIKAMGEAAAMLEDLPFHIVDAGSLTLGRLDMLVRRYKRRLAARGQSLDLVVVDYLQLLRCDEKKPSSYEAVSEISRRLKATAKDHEVSVFALAQLSREVEKRSDKKPQLSDLRDSGQIEQDADAVLFLYRHEYYLKLVEPKPGDPELGKWRQSLADCEGMIDFICAKRRNGVTGARAGFFHGAYQAVRG